jgi:hypothetical protein
MADPETAPWNRSFPLAEPPPDRHTSGRANLACAQIALIESMDLSIVQQ